ncbi:MAG: hypothetical protein ACYSR4_09740, partial [Planctomycetota bacterium]
MKELDIEKIRLLIQMAIEEDIGRGDVTTRLLFKGDTAAKAHIISREEIVVCGMGVVREILRCIDERLKLRILANDGKGAYVGCKMGTIEGPLCSMLS